MVMLSSVNQATGAVENKAPDARLVELEEAPAKRLAVADSGT
jgi:hypothetical protein